jgi:hypothetical protein
LLKVFTTNACTKSIIIYSFTYAFFTRELRVSHRKSIVFAKSL